MGIQIILSPKRALAPYDAIRDRLSACYEALRFFKGGLFSPETAELWLNAPSEALGGIRKGTWSSTNAFEAINLVNDQLRKLKPEELANSIVTIRGIWSFDESRLDGYLTAYSGFDWRDAYGDIEISAYASKDYEDIVDALWATQDMSHLIPQFLDSFQKGIEKTEFTISQITFSRGILTEEDPSNLMAIYLLGERRGLIGIFYRARKKIGDPDVLSKSPPLSTKFFVQALASEDIVMQRINKKLSDTMLVEIKRKSALYVAKTKDSFQRFYDEISNAVIKPALNKLPKEEAVREKIREGLSEYKD
jgi:hypothetical protein